MPTPSVSAKVLVAHTDQQFRERLRYGLEFEGYTVLEAADGEQGLDAAIKEQPNLILIDLVLPRLSGVKMMQKMYTQAPQLRPVPTIAVIDSRTREDDIDGIVSIAPQTEFIKSDWVLGHIVAKTREMLMKTMAVKQP